MTYIPSEDMKWLADVHIKGADMFACAIIYGNKDCPTRIELYKVDDYRCKPVVYEWIDEQYKEV